MAIRFLFALVTAAALCGSGSARAATPTAAARRLVVSPAQVALAGRYASARLVLAERDATGRLHAATRAALQIVDPALATIDAGGTIRPRHDGRTVLLVRTGSHSIRVPVDVRGLAKPAAPSFLNDVLPVLTHAGCNQGACHGAASGKGGFKLSLLAYDPDSDYWTITHARSARRVDLAQPAASLLLLKPTLSVAHRGGQRFAVGSAEYRVLRDWIGAGAPGPQVADPHLRRLDVFPAAAALAIGQTQPIRVMARYSDGSSRDVTAETLFGASDASVVAVSPTGETKAVQPGEGAAVIRYQGLVAVASVSSPFGPVTAWNAARGSAASPIDRLVDKKLASLGLAASPICGDSDFLRRATLDAIGRLPTPDEVRAFLSDRDPDKRNRLIDTLLDRPEFTDFWSLKWADLLRCSSDFLSPKEVFAYSQWIRLAVAQDRPWDSTVRALLTAEGDTVDNGAACFYRTARDPEELAEASSQTFLGVRIQCARCHNHPYDRWTQNQYYQMSAFFARVGHKRGDESGDHDVFAADTGEVRHPKTNRAVAACALDGRPLPADYAGDRRDAFADWITAPGNPFFAHSIVNRLWRHFMGRGFVDPVDDLRATNPPSNGALFDYLASDLTRHGYDLKYLMRIIMRSKTYQRSSAATRTNVRDDRFGSHFVYKRLSAEELLDALAAATAVPEKFSGMPADTRADQLPDSSVPSYFLDLFGRPARRVTCACERTDEPNVMQVLHLMNSPDVSSRLASKTGLVAQLAASTLPPGEIAEQMWLATLSRFPTPHESGIAVHVIAAAHDRRKALEDLMWALINTKEFVFNH